MNRHRLQLSPALIVALLGLVIAAAGTAVAGPASLERALTKPKVKRIAAKEANRAITKREPVFARVAADGTVDLANSSGIAQSNVTAGNIAGYYCFSGFEFGPQSATANADWDSNPDLLATIGVGGNAACPSGTQLYVDMRAADGTGSLPGGFFVTIQH